MTLPPHGSERACHEGDCTRCQAEQRAAEDVEPLMGAPDPIDWSDVEYGIGLPPEAETPRKTVDRPLPDFGAPTADAACQAERARVLRHPDIAKRLTERPLSYSRPEIWNGYVPPPTWQGRNNDSPYRAALLSIITAAVEADKESTP